MVNRLCPDAAAVHRDKHHSIVFVYVVAPKDFAKNFGEVRSDIFRVFFFDEEKIFFCIGQ